MLGKGKVAVGGLVFITGVVFGYSIALYRSRGRAAVPGTTTTLGPWAATFKVPSSMRLPDKDPVLKFEFTRDRMASLDELKLTVSNLTDQSYLVTYGIYAYNTKGKRVSGDFDKFAIGKHESVIRQIMLSTYGSAPSLPPEVDPQMRASTFTLSVKVEK